MGLLALGVGWICCYGWWFLKIDLSSALFGVGLGCLQLIVQISSYLQRCSFEAAVEDLVPILLVDELQRFDGVIPPFND